MRYLDALLSDGETVLYAARRHWFVLFARMTLELILLVLLIGVAALSIPAWGETGQYVAIAASVLGLVILVSALVDHLRWRNEQFVVTDRRVLQLKGVLDKRVLESSLEKINDVELHQTLFGRIFDYGTIDILTGSEEALNRMEAIAHPLEFKRAMQDARAHYDGYLDRSQVQIYEHPGVEVQRMLEQLAALRDRGILSDAEFEAKKREVLSRI